MTTTQNTQEIDLAHITLIAGMKGVEKAHLTRSLVVYSSKAFHKAMDVFEHLEFEESYHDLGGGEITISLSYLFDGFASITVIWPTGVSLQDLFGEEVDVSELEMDSDGCISGGYTQMSYDGEVQEYKEVDFHFFDFYVYDDEDETKD